MRTMIHDNIDALNMVTGGSIFHTEAEVTAAGIELWEVYGEKRGEGNTPGILAGHRAGNPFPGYRIGNL